MKYCQYKDIFGQPRKGVHQYRIAIGSTATHQWSGSIALVDTVVTLIGAYILSKLLGMNYWVALLITLVVGVAAHWFFCVDTPDTRLLKRLLSANNS